MTEEEIMLMEARSFYSNDLLHMPESAMPKEITQSIVHRMHNFNTKYERTIFLEEIMICYKEALHEHIKVVHHGETDPSCRDESTHQELRSYLQQELEKLQAEPEEE